jgi:xanthine dehydrogenase YagR molybdenum-binding subunit
MQEPVRKKKKIKVTRTIDGVEREVEIEVDDTGEGLKWGPNDKHAILNKKIPRVDGPLKVSGTAQYTYDVKLPGMLYARILRAPHARARIKRFDASAALKIPGVKAVVEAPSPQPQGPQPDTPPSREIYFEGQPIAAVAATTPEIADDAIHAMVVEYEVLPHVVTADEAVKPDAPRVLPKGNITPAEERGDKSKVEAAFANCDAVVEADYRTSVIHHACLETHGMVVDYRGGDAATVYASTQGTFTIPKEAADALGLPESAVTAIVEHMGGGFGSKFGIGIEGQFACRLSKQTRSPVKLMLTRHDEFVMARNRSGSWQTLKGGAKKDGTLVAVQAVQRRLGGLGQGSQAGQPYIYTAASFHRQVVSVHTNTNESTAMRAPGHPQANFAMESLMDELAYKLDMDPIEFRKKNLTGENGAIYHRQLDRVAREIGWERRNKTPGAGSGPRRRGIGCAVGVWGAGGNNQCKVDVRVTRDGAVTVAVGTQDLGTGTRTYTRAIVAEELGLTMNDVVEKIGNSRLGSANASGGSTTVPSLAPAVKDAAVNARQMIAEKIAPLLGVKPEEVTFADRKATGGGKSLTWKQVCAALPPAGISARGEWRSELASRGAHGACAAEVEVDIETGFIKPIKIVHIQDVGLPLNRLAIESQINGGVIQSLGMVLYEGRVMDSKLGVMVNAGFLDYKLPGTMEMPEIVPLIDDTDPREAVIGVGEPALIPTVGAVANAVFNACGVRVRELPITPDKILMGLMTKEKTV